MAAAQSVPAAPPAAPPLLPVGSVVGPWVVTRRIGRGTFSEVFEARHAQSRVLCALKMDKPGTPPEGLLLESSVLQRLQRFACVPRHYGLLDAPAAHALLHGEHVACPVHCGKCARLSAALQPAGQRHTPQA